MHVKYSYHLHEAWVGCKWRRWSKGLLSGFALPSPSCTVNSCSMTHTAEPTPSIGCSRRERMHGLVGGRRTHAAQMRVTGTRKAGWKHLLRLSQAYTQCCMTGRQRAVPGSRRRSLHAGSVISEWMGR